MCPLGTLALATGLGVPSCNPAFARIDRAAGTVFPVILGTSTWGVLLSLRSLGSKKAASRTTSTATTPSRIHRPVRDRGGGWSSKPADPRGATVVGVESVGCAMKAARVAPAPATAGASTGWPTRARSMSARISEALW